jgi:hypothetical protein
MRKILKKDHRIGWAVVTVFDNEKLAYDCAGLAGSHLFKTIVYRAEETQLNGGTQDYHCDLLICPHCGESRDEKNYIKP